MTNFKKVEIARNSLGYDAWNRPKVINDFSLFHGIFTYDIPSARWKEYLGTAEQASFANATSVNGMLNLTSTAGVGVSATLSSKRHARYQPNRGHLYSTALNIPVPNNDGYADFGLFNEENGVFFRVIGSGAAHTVHAVIVRDGAIVNNVDITANLPVGVDITKGQVFDIQVQWRGVGDIFFYCNLELVHTFNLLGTLDFLSFSNPALPVAYRCVNVTGEYSLNVGCVDVTTEGGHGESRTLSSATTGDVLLATVANTTVAMLAYKIPDTYGGKIFTRDSILKKITTFCKDEATHSFWIGRGITAPNVLGLTWAQNLSSLNESVAGGGASALDVAFQADLAGFAQVASVRQEKDFSRTSVISTDESEFVLSAGDIVVVTLRSDGVSTGGVTISVDVEI